MSVDDWKHAMICFANYARFGASFRRLLNPCVQSRMCLWCKSGCGTVKINHHAFACEQGDYFFLPWNHSVEYISDPGNPFYLGGIHMVPAYDPDAAVEFDVPHTSAHHLYNNPWRKDAAIPMLEGVQHQSIGSDSPLYLLSESIVKLFRSSSPHDEDQFRILAQALLRELMRTLGSRKAQPTRPSMLRQLLSYVDQNMAKAISVDELAGQVGRSNSGITALFRAHCGKAPIQWIIDQRIARARDLLSTTHLSMGEIGVSVGISDPFYFSKLFKKNTGQSPKAYRKQHQNF